MLTKAVADYICTALEKAPPDAAREAGVAHLLDTVASMVAGSQMPVGPLAKAFVQQMGGRAEATVVGSPDVTTTIYAALANGIMAHADETDDSHAPSLTHPGCSIVPAALAVAEKYHRSGRDLLRAVVLGYDVGTRLALSLGGGTFLDHYDHSSHAFGGTFGSCAAGAALAGFDVRRTEYALAYAVQLVSGIPCWLRDPDHMEKAFLFGGMPAQSGVQAVAMAAAGFTGSAEPLEGKPGLFSAFPDKADPRRLTDELGVRFEVTRTTIKKWSTGSPIQSALDSLLALIRELKIAAADVERIHVVLPPRRAIAVDDRAMPAVNLQYQLSLLLIDGDVTFASGHDEHRMRHDPHVAALRKRITIEADPQAPEGGQAHLTVTLRDGRRLEKHTPFVRGTPGNPMPLDEIVTKARGIMQPVQGAGAEELISALLAIESLPDVAALRPLLQHGPPQGSPHGSPHG